MIYLKTKAARFGLAFAFLAEKVNCDAKEKVMSE
jgi:hypothetical protein